MKKVLLFFFILSFLLRLFPILTTPAYAAGGTVVHIGDSLTVGMYNAGLEDKYKSAGWTPIIPGNNPNGIGGCDGYKAGFPCKGIDPDGLAAIDANASSIKSAQAIVIELGTNPLATGNDSDAFKSSVNQMVSKIKSVNPNIKIYWVNLATLVNVDSYNARNAVLSEIAKTGSINLIDWNSKLFASGGASLFGPDGIHLTGNGYSLMGDFVSSSVTGGGSNSTSGTSSGTVTATSCFMTKVGNPAGPPPPFPADCNTSSNVSANINCTDPVPTTNVDQAIKQKFNITMTGFDNDHLMWAYERFCEVSQTNFLKLVNGAQILAVSQNISQQVGCPGQLASIGADVYGFNNVIIFPYTPKEFFKYILIHELGHVVHNCNVRSEIRWNDVIVAAQQEGAVSYYGSHAAACTGSDNNSENYADAVAYYLDHAAGFSTASCGGAAPANPPNPFWSSPVLRPLQFDIMKSVIK